MDRVESELILKFKEIKSRGWIETSRHGDQCLGNAFEDLVGVDENNHAEADYKGIELKSHRNITSSLTSLFSKSPSSPKGVNTYLRETYGVIENTSGKLLLNTTVAGNKFNTHRGGHEFKVEVDRKKEKIWLIVRTADTKEILEDSNHGKNVCWDFQVLSNALSKKLKKIAISYGDEKDDKGKHFVKYDKLIIFEGLTLEKLLTAIEVGDLYIDIRIGVYGSGKNVGKTHDHGTGFRINLEKLFTYGTTTLVE